MEPNADRVARAIAAVEGVREVIALPTVDSTNDALRRLADAGRADAWTVVVADRQTAGRGRLGRAWHSPPGVGLYLSCLLRPRDPVSTLPRWTLIAALAACEACRSAVGGAVGIKWPNDLVAGGRKLGGVLADLRNGARGPELVVGIGINVGHRARDLPPELVPRATSLRMLGGDMMSRAELAARLVAGLVLLASEVEAGGWDGVRGRFAALAPGTCGGRVRVVEPGGRSVAWTGVPCGIDDRGALRVRRDDDGREVAVHDGESVVAVEGP